MASGDPRLGSGARRRAEAASEAGELHVSAVSFCEVAWLVGKGRIELAPPVQFWRLQLLEQGLEEIPVDGAIVIAATELPGLHGDPADRIIVASALALGAELLTADERLLAWKGPLVCADART